MIPSKINQEIGNRIKLARISRNLSQDSVAEDLGISVSAYSNMERGAVEITVSRVIKVSEILKTDWLNLLGVNQNISQSTASITQPASSENIFQKIPGLNFYEIVKEIETLKQEIKKLQKPIIKRTPK